ncbi:hypothetical protein TCAL_02572 [Tigriopus californicus]|uniref:Thyroid transcription factor 1-associated protein 26 n=1 Tax=Tigriopus californicus TaxID=6832 RepID=A0A553P800_TIGCA|nr:thyroid transcription factor 1-associated protein 26-like [Tigriopus californicus]TRY73812.1 hypothetical protein TCAL_02572 [Tigriopus californicus]
MSQNEPCPPVAPPSGGKKPFDKKKWRENKYSKKTKVDQWKGQREKSLKHRYFKMMRKHDGANANMAPLGSPKPASTLPAADTPSNPALDPTTAPNKKWHSIKQAKQEFEARQQKAEKRQKAEEKKKRQMERVEALKQYRQKKAEKFKILSQKTRKGQPVMAGRLELLLEKIQAQSNE